jgi:fluoride ion exporter CrcB/FEX
MRLFLLNIGANVVFGLIAVVLGRIAVRAISF